MLEFLLVFKSAKVFVEGNVKSQKTVLKLPKTISLETAFDFSVTWVTPEEVHRIRNEALEGLVAIPEHAVFAALDDSITATQILAVVLNGVPVSKDLLNHKSRVPGINFEGRSGGKRRLRAKVSWSDGYYVVTVHLVKAIKRRSR